jgi:hypothetical protein
MLALEGQTPKRILIRPTPNPTFRRRLAERELLRGLAGLFPAAEVRISDAPAADSDLTIALRVDSAGLANPEAYEIHNEGGQAVLRGSGEQALLYAVFEFLERQGAFFGIDGVSYPIDPPLSAVLPAVGQTWKASPRFSTRGLLPWPDFLNCITVYNEEDFRAYFESMLRMRFNTFGMHVYTGANQWAESYLSFEYAGPATCRFSTTAPATAGDTSLSAPRDSPWAAGNSSMARYSAATRRAWRGIPENRRSARGTCCAQASTMPRAWASDRSGIPARSSPCDTA